jgi:Glutamate racemase
VARIAIFDSGLGSLSIIKEIRKVSKNEIIYFADQKNYPYGKKSQAQLHTIIQKSIKMLKENFSPDIIVVASNTPSLMLDLVTQKIIDVKPPLIIAKKNLKNQNKLEFLQQNLQLIIKGYHSTLKKIIFQNYLKFIKLMVQTL